MKILGCALLLLGFTSSAFATGVYKEIWNPPEARGIPLHRTTSHKQIKHTRNMPRLVKARTPRAPMTTPAPTLTMKRHTASTGVTAKTPEPDLSDIPRQITPEGNILRVDSRDAAAEVSR
ncbi:hypothetical protein P3T21_000097 [Paraburkholderia sp. GAS334]